jgi:hypothetical protein
MNPVIPTPRKPFRAFVTNQFYENRDEYDAAGQTQPHTYSEYVWQNISLLKAKYRLTFRKKGSIV